MENGWIFDTNTGQWIDKRTPAQKRAKKRRDKVRALFSNYVLPAIVAVALVVLLLGLSVGSTLPVSYYICTRKAMYMQKPTRWDWVSGCYVEAQPGLWVPADQYVGITITK